MSEIENIAEDHLQNLLDKLRTENNRVIVLEDLLNIVNKILEAGVPDDYIIKTYISDKFATEVPLFPYLRVDAQMSMIRNSFYRHNNEKNNNKMKEIDIIIPKFLALYVYVEIGFNGYEYYAGNDTATIPETGPTRTKTDVFEKGFPIYNNLKNECITFINNHQDHLPEWAKKLDFFKELC